MILPDVLRPNLNVVFCGTASGTRSAQVGAYYAGPGNQFWDILFRTGLTPRKLAPQEFPVLPEYGIGLTDLSKTQFGADKSLRPGDFDVMGFRSKIEQFSPKALAFNGKKASQKYYGKPVGYGRQPETLGQTVVFVLPSTSGAARGFWNERWWYEVAVFVGKESDR
jgi:TDG/mug DNA glycosylase family protein